MTVMSIVIGAYMVRSAGVGDVPNQPSAEGVTVVLLSYLPLWFSLTSRVEGERLLSQLFTQLLPEPARSILRL